MSITLRIDDSKLQAKLKRLGRDAQDGTIPLKQFDRAVKADMGRAWNARALGGTVRGQKWKGFAPQYTRKDGTVVPAYGGIAKASGKGKVKGRLRPSGQRVKQTSIINQDTGHLRQMILNSAAVIKRKRLLLIGAALPDYGEHVLSLDNRNILRWQLSKDMNLFKRIGRAYLNTLAKRENAKR